MKSPDGKHRAELTYDGEIRFGPVYYTLGLDGLKIRGRIFGQPLKWSDDSIYLATQEWLTIDYQQGPITRIALFDIPNKLISEFKTIVKGYAEQFVFEGNILIYRKSYQGEGIIKEVEVNISKIDNWKSIGL